MATPWPLWAVIRIPACRMSRLEMVSWWQHVYVVGLRWTAVLPVLCCLSWRDRGSLQLSISSDRGPKTLPPFPNLSCPVPTQPLLHMVQHVADWVAPFPVVSNLLHRQIPPYSPFTSPLFAPPPYVHKSWGQSLSSSSVYKTNKTLSGRFRLWFIPTNGNIN